MPRRLRPRASAPVAEPEGSTRSTPTAAIAGRIAIAIVCATLASCSLFKSEPKFTALEGSATSTEPLLLSQNATLVIELSDTTRGDARPDVLAKERLERPAKWPIHFSLIYDQRAVLPGHRYALVATLYSGPDVTLVTSGGKLEFRDHLYTPVEIVLEAPVVRGGGAQR
jgi:uncharacterized lipoprotein YbaY